MFQSVSSDISCFLYTEKNKVIIIISPIPYEPITDRDQVAMDIGCCYFSDKVVLSFSALDSVLFRH